MSRHILSRKLWVTLVTQGLIIFVFNNLNLDESRQQQIAQWLVALAGSYVVGQGYVDGQRAKSAPGPTTTQSSREE